MPVGVRVVVARAPLSSCRGKMEAYFLECPEGLVSWFLSQVEIQNLVGSLSPREAPNLLCVLDLTAGLPLKAEQSLFPFSSVGSCLQAPARWGPALLPTYTWALGAMVFWGDLAELPVGGQGGPWDRS